MVTTATQDFLSPFLPALNMSPRYGVFKSSHNESAYLNVSQVILTNLSRMATFSEDQSSLTLQYTYMYVAESSITIPLLTTILGM